MDTIQQLTDNKKVAIIWYGECGEDCVDYVLTDSTNEVETNKIDHIYEIADDQTKSIFYSSYVSHVHNSGVQTLTTLQCGHAYYVVLKEGNDTLEIPNMTLAHAGIGNAGKISQSCAVAPELGFVDLVANFPADLKLKLTVNIDDLVAPCASNTWKYKIIKGGETETAPYDETIYDDVAGPNTTNVGVPVEVISDVLPEGGVYYKVIIWGVNADGDKITEEPDQEKVVLMPWPSGAFSIVGTVDVDYLEYEGPSGESPQQTLSGQQSLIDTLHLIKPSMKTTPDADTNVENWQYQINSDGWVDYDTIAGDFSVVLVYTDKISWKLKEGLSAGNEVDDSTNYNATMVVKCVENNGTIKFAEADLIGEVLNRRITIRVFQDDRNFNASLDITRYNVKRWDYKLEKLSDNKQTVTKTIKDFNASDIVATGVERGSEPEDSTINIQTAIETHGAGYYRVTVQGYHKTNDGIVVTDDPAVEEAFFNWPAPTFAISSTGANATTVDVFYREYEGPSLQEALVLTAQSNVASVEFTSLTNETSWFYGVDAAAIVTPLPVNPTNIVVTDKNNINFILKEDQKASGTVDVAYDSNLRFKIVGKDTLHQDATGTILNPEITIKGHVKERITSIDSLVIQSSDPNANTINLRATFDLTEINRYTFTWNKDSTPLSTTDADTGTTYNSNNLTKDLSVDLNTDNRGVYKFELIGKHTDAGNTDENETNWVQGQIAPKVEETITVSYPAPTFAVTSTISDGYKERDESSRATSPKVKVTTFHWMDNSDDITFTGQADSIWEYKKSGGTWISVPATPVVVTKSEEIEVRVKEGKLVEDNGDETLNWSATSLDGTTKPATTTMTATVTLGESGVFQVTPSVSDGYQEQNESGRSASPKVKVTTFDEMDESKDITFTGQANSIWEYKKSGGTWISVPATPVVVTKSEEIEVRVKEGKLVSDNGTETLNWSATSLNGITKPATTTMTATITPGEVLPGVLWFSFGGTTTLNDMKTSDWIQANTFEQVKVYADNTWPLPGLFAAFCKPLTEGQPIDMTPMTSTPTHNVTGNTPFSKAEDFGPLDATNLLHGKTVSSDTTGLFVSVDLPYTKIEIKDQATYTTALNSFISASDADEMFAVALASNPTQPDKVTTELFSSDDIDMSCKTCSDLENLPHIFVKVAEIADPFKYKGKILGCTGDSGWQKTGSPWDGSHVVYTCISSSPPTLSANPIIEEIYFTSDSAGETKIKFADFSC
jgi:hypothetical protein